MFVKRRAVRLKQTSGMSLGTVFTALIATTAMADDIDVYRAEGFGQQKPNILFVLDYSESMDAYLPTTSQKKKIEILQDAVISVLNGNLTSINAGIGSMYSTESSGIKWPISELTADAHTVDPDIPENTFTVKDIIEKRVLEPIASGDTATVDALAEAALYFRGGPVLHNDADPNYAPRHKPAVWDPATDRYTGGHLDASIAASYLPRDAYTTNGPNRTYECIDYTVSGGRNECEVVQNVYGCQRIDRHHDPVIGRFVGPYDLCRYDSTGTWETPHYESPINSSCQTNAIVLISDGKPTSGKDGATLASVSGLSKWDCDQLTDIFGSYSFNNGHEQPASCGPEIAHDLAHNDQVSGIPNSKVKTYTVGFDIEGYRQEYLDRLAADGDGLSFSANSPEELIAYLEAIVDDLVGGSENFVAPSINIDRDSFSHDNRAFFSLFSPSSRRAWEGNLKGYFVTSNGLVDIHGKAATEVVNNRTVFSDSAQSFWSAEADGDDVLLGGASEKIQTLPRNLYTYVGNTIPSSGIDLSAAGNTDLHSSNPDITTAMLGPNVNDTLREEALDWIQDAPMGDAMHSRVVAAEYTGRTVLFTMTNQGFIHAIDATAPTTPTGDLTGGNELFAFMPKQLLDNLPAISQGQNGLDHIYGLDGQITPWHEDHNGNGVVDGTDSLLLVFGMRRGGNAYYALDVTDPTTPKLMWKIDGDSADFAGLAQSWSRMSLIPVVDNGVVKRVLAFAGGYDAANVDDTDGRVPANGNALFMINRNGELEWKVDASDSAAMQYSIPSDLTIIDADNDGNSDRIYIGDTGGQLFRVDYDDIGDGGRSADVTVLADFGGTKNQPFFYPPSVSLNQKNGEKFLAITIGSGNRTEPMDTASENRIYMVRDKHVDSALPGSFFTFTHSNLYDATYNEIQSTDTAVENAAQSAMDNAEGWYIRLATGEKVMSAVVTFEGKVFATTFEPGPASSQYSCGVSNKSKLYSMSVKDATPVSFNGDGSLNSNATTAESRSSELTGNSIPSSPFVVFPKGSSTLQLIVDKENVASMRQQLGRVFWHAK